MSFVKLSGVALGKTRWARWSVWTLPVIAPALWSTATQAADTSYYWDGGTTNITTTGDGVSQGGAGTWDITTQNWDQGAGLAYVAWPNTSTSDAVFAGTAGTVTLGANIVAGTLNVGTTGYTFATGGDTLTLNNGVTISTSGLLDTVSSNSGAGGLVLTSGAAAQTLNIASGSTLVVSGLFSGSDVVTNAGAGRLGLTGANNTFTGQYVINAGVLTISSDSALGTAPSTPTAADITLNGGLLQDGVANNAITSTFGQSVTFSLNANRGITLGASGGSIQIGYGASYVLTVPGIISGPGGLTKTDSGTLLLSGNNTYAGTTTISSGVLAVTANNALGTTAAGTAVNGGSTLDLQNVAYTTAEAVALNGGTLATSTGTSSFAGAVSNAGNSSTISVTGTQLTLSGSLSGAAGGYVNKTGAGTLVLTGTGDNSGGRVQVSAGTVVLDKTSSGSVHSVGSNGGTDYALIVSGGTAQLSGTGGDQIYINSAVEITSGNFDLNGLSEGFDGLVGTGGTVTNTSAATTSTLTLGQNNSAGSPSYSGILADGNGTLALVKTGTGTQTLGGVNTYSGGTTLAGGTLAIGVANALPSHGTLSLTGGTLNSNGFADTIGPMTITSGGSTLQFGAAGDTGNVLTFSTISVGTGTLAITNWDGKATGGGGDQFLDSTAPSAAVLSAISFINPGGLPVGTYPATDVRSGSNYEIVPVPEPVAMGLLSVGALGLLLRRRNRSQDRRGA